MIHAELLSQIGQTAPLLVPVLGTSLFWIHRSHHVAEMKTRETGRGHTEGKLLRSPDGDHIVFVPSGADVTFKVDEQGVQVRDYYPGGNQSARVRILIGPETQTVGLDKAGKPIETSLPETQLLYTGYGYNEHVLTDLQEKRQFHEVSSE